MTQLAETTPFREVAFARSGITTSRSCEQKQATSGSKNPPRFGQRNHGSVGVTKDVVENYGIELAVGERQVIHVALAQAAVLDTGEQQLGACQLPGIGIDVDTNRTLGT